MGVGRNAHATKPKNCNDRREVNLSLCVPPLIPGLRIETVYDKLSPFKPLRDIDKSLLHELVHVLDFLNDELYGAYLRYYDNLRRWKSVDFT